MFATLLTFCAFALSSALPIRFQLRADDSSLSLTPPQAPPVWNHTAEDILRLTKEAIDTLRGQQDQVAQLSPEASNFSSVSTQTFHFCVACLTWLSGAGLRRPRNWGHDIQQHYSRSNILFLCIPC